MDSWASRRKSIYLGVIVFLLSAISFAIFWKFWYKAPTCFDGFRNGDEAGVDCGGSCSLVCSDSTLKPIVRWDPRLFKVSEGVWSAIVYIENPNVSVDATYLPYTLTIYDKDSNVLEERKGVTILPKNKTVGVFEGNILIREGTDPRRAIFELGNDIVWQRNEKENDDLQIGHGPLLKLDSQPRVEANIKNLGITDTKNIELIITIFDGKDNAIAASRTFVENLKKNESSDVFFTWPKPFLLGLKACEKPSDIIMVLDRSGSMASVSKSPPEPLTSVKNAASYFISKLQKSDTVGLVSFATEASSESGLTNDFDAVASSVSEMKISEDGVQYTNIADAIYKSLNLFALKDDTDYNTQKIIVLLTDGVATKPEDPKGSKTEVEAISYAESRAREAANSAKQGNVSIYAIGLGKAINEEFLKGLASSPQSYFFAPATSTLLGIYESISSSICKEVPARIEITYRIFGDLI